MVFRKEFCSLRILVIIFWSFSSYQWMLLKLESTTYFNYSIVIGYSSEKDILY
jgi:hypothetical protein